MVTLPVNPQNKAIFSENSLLFMSGKIEPYKNSNQPNVLHANDLDTLVYTAATNPDA